MVFPANLRSSRPASASLPYRFPYQAQDCPSLIVDFDADDNEEAGCIVADAKATACGSSRQPSPVSQPQRTASNSDGKGDQLTEVAKLKQVLEAKQKELERLRAQTKQQEPQHPSTSGQSNSGQQAVDTGKSQLAQVAVNGEQRVALKLSKPSDLHPRRSPNGKQILLQARLQKADSVRTRALKRSKSHPHRKPAQVGTQQDAEAQVSAAAVLATEETPDDSKLAEAFLSTIVLPPVTRSSSVPLPVPVAKLKEGTLSGRSSRTLKPKARSVSENGEHVLSLPREPLTKIVVDRPQALQPADKGHEEQAPCHVTATGGGSRLETRMATLIAQKNLLEIVARGVFRKLRDSYDEVKRLSQGAGISKPETTGRPVETVASPSAHSAAARSSPGPDTVAAAVAARRQQLAAFAARKEQAMSLLRRIESVPPPQQADNDCQELQTGMVSESLNQPGAVALDRVGQTSPLPNRLRPPRQGSGAEVPNAVEQVRLPVRSVSNNRLLAVEPIKTVSSTLDVSTSNSQPANRSTGVVHTVENVVGGQVFQPGYMATFVLNDRLEEWFRLSNLERISDVLSGSRQSEEAAGTGVAETSRKRTLTGTKPTQPSKRARTQFSSAISCGKRLPWLFESISSKVSGLAEEMICSNVLLEPETSSLASAAQPSFRRTRYDSPLDRFTAYRLTEAFRRTPNASVTSPILALGLDPHWPVCPFECRGSCKNMQCVYQMVSDYSLNEAAAADVLRQVYARPVLKLSTSALPRPVQKLVSSAQLTRTARNSAGAPMERNGKFQKKRVAASKQASMSAGGVLPVYTVWGTGPRKRTFESVMLSPANFQDNSTQASDVLDKEHGHAKGMERYHKDESSRIEALQAAKTTEVVQPNSATGAQSDKAVEKEGRRSFPMASKLLLRSWLKEDACSYLLWLQLVVRQTGWQEAALVLQQAINAFIAAPGGSSRDTAKVVLDLVLRLFSVWSAAGAHTEMVVCIKQLVDAARSSEQSGTASKLAASAVRAINGHSDESAVLWLSCLHVLATNDIPDAVYDRLGYPQDCFVAVAIRDLAELSERSDLMTQVLDVACRAVGLSTVSSVWKGIDFHSLSKPQLAVALSCSSVSTTAHLASVAAPASIRDTIQGPSATGLLAISKVKQDDYSAAEQILTVACQAIRAGDMPKHDSETPPAPTFVSADRTEGTETVVGSHACSGRPSYSHVNSAALNLLQGHAVNTVAALEQAVLSAETPTERQYALMEYIALLSAVLKAPGVMCDECDVQTLGITALEQQVAARRKQRAVFEAALQLFSQLISATVVCCELQPLESLLPSDSKYTSELAAAPAMVADCILTAADLLTGAIPLVQQVHLIEVLASARPASPAIARWLVNWGLQFSSSWNAQLLAWLVPLVASHCVDAQPPPSPAVWLQAAQLCETHYPAAAAELCSKAAKLYPFVDILQKKRQNLQAAQGG